MARGEAQRVVVVTPASLKHQWAREIERYAGRQAVVLGKGPAARRAALRSDAPYKVLSYELTWRELPGLRDLDADVLILDEAQRAKNFRTAHGGDAAGDPVALPVRAHRDAGREPPGRPVLAAAARRPGACWGRCGASTSSSTSRTRRARSGATRTSARCAQRIAPVVLRRRKEEVLTQLPPLVQQTRYIPLSKAQKALEAGPSGRRRRATWRWPRSARSRQEEMQRLQMALLKARQACNAAELCDPDSPEQGAGKLDELEALIEEIVGAGHEQGAGVLGVGGDAQAGSGAAGCDRRRLGDATRRGAVGEAAGAAGRASGRTPRSGCCCARTPAAWGSTCRWPTT